MGELLVNSIPVTLTYVRRPSAGIVLLFLGYSMCVNLGIIPNEILRLGNKSPKLRKYRPILDWEAACIWL